MVCVFKYLTFNRIKFFLFFQKTASSGRSSPNLIKRASPPLIFSIVSAYLMLIQIVRLIY
jgi:hypothetical protein